MGEVGLRLEEVKKVTASWSSVDVRQGAKRSSPYRQKAPRLAWQCLCRWRLIRFGFHGGIQGATSKRMREMPEKGGTRALLSILKKMAMRTQKPRGLTKSVKQIKARGGLQTHKEGRQVHQA